MSISADVESEDAAPLQAAGKKRPESPKEAPKGRLIPRIAPWAPLPLRPDEPPLRGPDAVQHEGETRGRRSRYFPDLNISATAARIGVSKSHLSKILSGENRPSIEVALKLAAALGVEVEAIIRLYRPQAGRTEKKHAKGKTADRRRDPSETGPADSD